MYLCEERMEWEHGFKVIIPSISCTHYLPGLVLGAFSQYGAQTFPLFTDKHTEALRGHYCLKDAQVAGGWEKWWWTLECSEDRTTAVTALSPSPQSLLASPGGLTGFAEEGSEAQKSPSGLCIRSLMMSASQIQGETETKVGVVFKLSWPVARCYSYVLLWPDIWDCFRKKEKLLNL